MKEGKKEKEKRRDKFVKRVKRDLGSQRHELVQLIIKFLLNI